MRTLNTATTTGLTVAGWCLTGVEMKQNEYMFMLACVSHILLTPCRRRNKLTADDMRTALEKLRKHLLVARLASYTTRTYPCGFIISPLCRSNGFGAQSAIEKVKSIYGANRGLLARAHILLHNANKKGHKKRAAICRPKLFPFALPLSLYCYGIVIAAVPTVPPNE